MRILAAMVVVAVSMALAPVDAHAQSRGASVRTAASATAARFRAARSAVTRRAGGLLRRSPQSSARTVAQRSAPRAQHVDETPLSAAAEASAAPAPHAAPSSADRRAAQRQAAFGQFLQRLHIQVGQQVNSRGATTSTAIAGSAQ